MPGTIQSNQAINLTDKWIFSLGLAIPLSIAALNIFAGIGLIVIIIYYARNIRLKPQHFLFLAIVSVFFIHEAMLNQAISRFGQLLSTFLIFVVLGQSQILDYKSLQRFSFGLLIGLFVGFGTDQILRPDYALWATTGLKYPNEAAYVALVTAILFLSMKTVWKHGIILSVLIFIVMTESRSSFVAIGTALSVYFLVMRNQKMVIGLAIVTFVFCCIGFIIYAQNTSSPELKNMMSAYPRLDLLVHGIQMVKSTQWCGTGENQLSKETLLAMPKLLPAGIGWWNEIVIPSVTKGAYDRIPFHNLFAHALIEHGILGLSSLLILFLYPFAVFLFSKQIQPSPCYAMGLAVWATFMVHCVFELGLYKPTAILIGVIVGITGIFFSPTKTRAGKF